jgi:DNA-binding HxlR family transcriptional regulator
MSQKRDQYAAQIPLDIRLAVDSLGGHDDTEYAVVALLSERSSLQFGELREELEIHQQTLTNALNDLQQGGVVRKQVGERIGDQSTGAYELTTTGERLLDGLYYASQSTDGPEGVNGIKEDEQVKSRDESLLKRQESGPFTGAGTGDSVSGESSLLDDSAMVPQSAGRAKERTGTNGNRGQRAQDAHSTDSKEERM